MAFGVVSSSSTFVGSVSAYTQPEPVGTLFTSALVMILSCDALPGTHTITPPDGTWTQESLDFLAVDGQVCAVFVRQPGPAGGANGGANIGTGGNYTFTTGGTGSTGNGAQILIAINGANAAASFADFQKTIHDASVTNPFTMSAPAATAALANSLILHAYTIDGSGGVATPATPSGDTLIAAPVDGFATAFASYVLQVATGPSGVATSAVAEAANGWVGYTIAVSPASSASATATVAWLSA